MSATRLCNLLTQVHRLLKQQTHPNTLPVAASCLLRMMPTQHASLAAHQPRYDAGMNKMVINHLDKLFVTSDAHTIIDEMEVQHPAAKLVVFASRAQEQEIGDGTNFVRTDPDA